MRNFRYIIVVFALSICLQSCYAQKNQNSLDVVMKGHIEDFKKTLDNKDAELYIIMKYDFVDYKVDNTKFVEPTLDARYLEDKTCYLIQFTLKNDKLTAVNFKVNNKNRKELELINMLNGKVYELR